MFETLVKSTLYFRLKFMWKNTAQQKTCKTCFVFVSFVDFRSLTAQILNDSWFLFLFLLRDKGNERSNI